MGIGRSGNCPGRHIIEIEDSAVTGGGSNSFSLGGFHGLVSLRTSG